MPYKLWCEKCLSDMNRMYLRTKKIDHSNYFYPRYNKYGRGFEAIGWYCNQCRLFDLDKENIIEEIVEEIKE